MKKIIIMLLMLSLCLSVIACGKTKNGSTNTVDSKTKKDLTNAPSEEYVISCLRKVPGIIDVEAVTEANDPNGQLNKSGGYISQVYFSYSLVNQDSVYGNTVIEKGTIAGGSIEVYKKAHEAKKRDGYLSEFDGGILTAGSHCVVGTIVIRTSSELTASQQKLLENNIIYSLKGEIDSINKNIGTPKFDDEDNKHNESAVSYGKYFMEEYGNSYINILDENTVIIYDAFDDFDLQGYEKFEYTFIPVNNDEYKNAYPMLKVNMSILYPYEFSHYEFIFILDDTTVMYNAEMFSK